MPLSENEQQILREIERQFHAQDPGSAERLGSTTLPRYLARNCKWAALGFLAGIVILMASFASSWILGIFGFAVMLVSAVVFTHNLRRMGQHGWRQLRAASRGQNLNQAVTDAAERLRRRLGGDR